jgi:hypothetical protein
MNILDRNDVERELLLASVPLMNMEELEALLVQIRQEVMQLVEDNEEEHGEQGRTR